MVEVGLTDRIRIALLALPPRCPGSDPTSPPTFGSSRGRLMLWWSAAVADKVCALGLTERTPRAVAGTSARAAAVQWGQRSPLHPQLPQVAEGVRLGFSRPQCLETSPDCLTGRMLVPGPPRLRPVGLPYAAKCAAAQRQSRPFSCADLGRLGCCCWSRCPAPMAKSAPRASLIPAFAHRSLFVGEGVQGRRKIS